MGEIISDLVLRLLINLVVLTIVVRFIYYPNNGDYKKAFAYFAMAMMVFLVAAMLEHVKFEMGFALGLFAIFSIIRYRTPSVDVKNMAYLFVVIGISAINALVDFFVLWRGMLLINTLVIVMIFILEKFPPQKPFVKQQLTFTPSNMAIVGKKEQLRQEIEDFVQLPVRKIEIEKINSSKNEISVLIYYKETS